ncbi:hypothetical protein CPB83DRAFT_879182 [Crepidotus variabilis]|uniref:C2H2-type domain-containing protein n=1 Tax=Crepidotus variabilis TaxID=179855 RepID=A0A9P6ERS4_9AGAR|nr:hypothetical protein CPB83DRAFT_879182 [Crepidotus variabilis]
MATLWDFSDYHNKTTSNHYNSPLMAAHTFSAEPVLLHPNEWADENGLGFDFQSNQAERSVSLAGLGIHNLNIQGGCNKQVGLKSDTGDPLRTSSDYVVGLPPFDHSDIRKNEDLSKPKYQRRLSLDSENSEPVKSEDSLSSDSSTDFALMFEQLSASTGLSVADFAEQLSVSAEATLKRMAEEGLGSVDVLYTEDRSQKNPKEETPKWSTPHLFLPRSTSWSNDGIGVNLADILPPDSPEPLAAELTQYFPTNALAHESEFSSDGHAFRPDDDSNTPRTTIPRFMKQEALQFVPPLLTFFPQVPPLRSLSDDERSTFPSPSSSEYSPEVSIGQKRPAGTRKRTRRISRSNISDDLVCQSPDLPLNIDEGNLPPINLGTPILDAHRGVGLEVLKAKAERYRLRNQGRDYDKRWLISFAGKLSARGELVDEFHCYVIGCKQKNKRRDHILIHVETHCFASPSRFLRKNECKRHELSHTGLRPFSCHLCPYPSTTFVRQDLLKRHMKRTHRLDLKADKENIEEAYHPRKKSRH